MNMTHLNLDPVHNCLRRSWLLGCICLLAAFATNLQAQMVPSSPEAEAPLELPETSPGRKFVTS